VNAIAICDAFKNEFTPKTRSDLIDRHQEYQANGDEVRHRASQLFFERLGLLSLLSDPEVHVIITTASASLLSVHNAFNNFYNEPPFAQRLAGLVAENRVPEAAQFSFVESVVTCATGNGYGVSWAAYPSYEKMIRSFSPSEIREMFGLAESDSILGRRVKMVPQCKAQFAQLVKLLDDSSIPTAVRPVYKKWMKIAAT
jgi:hypothetical protein